MLKNPTLLILGLVMFVNSLSYATIIPLLYPFASRFGIDPFGLSLLFASFSLAQFIATPIIGRLSDKYGRKPLLLFCLFGTSLSLALFASAQSAVMLFVARIADGITGGNNSVAQAMIADTTSGKERAQAFGILGAAFGFGFLLGPALGGVLSQFGLSIPFWFASGLAFIGTILGAVILKETLPAADQRKVNREPFINFKAIRAALMSPVSGVVLLITFVSALALNTFILGFQTYTTDILRLNTTQVGILFAVFGLISVIMQMFGLRVLLQKIPSKKHIITISFIGSAVLLALVATSTNVLIFGVLMAVFGIFSSPQNPVITGLLSERTNPEDQGGLLGINQAYLSMGQIIGPLIAGVVAAVISVHSVFVVAGLLYALGVLVAQRLYQPVKAPTNI